MSATATQTASGRTRSGVVEFSTFYAGEMLLGIDIRKIDEINRQTDLTVVPQAPACICGVVNLRGEVVTVLDLRTVLGLERSALTKATRNVVVRHRGEQVGLLVDRVADVVRVAMDEVEPPPPNLNGLDGRCFDGVYKLDEALLVLLNTEAVLSDLGHGADESSS